MSVIKRYSNRKLYDSDKRTYITLDDIADMIRLGEEVEVVDHESGQDITTSTLAQIIYEQEKKIGGMLPHNILARLIRTGGSRMQSFHDSFLAFVDPLQYTENEIKRRLNKLVEIGKITVEESGKLLELLLSDELLPAHVPNQEVETQPPEDAASREEVDRLLDQIESLEKELADLQDASPPAV